MGALGLTHPSLRGSIELQKENDREEIMATVQDFYKFLKNHPVDQYKMKIEGFVADRSSLVEHLDVLPDSTVTVELIPTTETQGGYYGYEVPYLAVDFTTTNAYGSAITLAYFPDGAAITQEWINRPAESSRVSASS